MPITLTKTFRFNQYYLQGDGGWCSGISIAAIIHLYANLDETLTYVSPQNAYTQTEEYVGLLRGTYDKLQEREASWAKPFRQTIHALQKPFDLAGNGEKPSGPYEYSFNSPGVAFLRLTVREPPDANYGSDFLSSFWPDSVTNHAGFAVWFPSGEAFVFDPNCGGGLFIWGKCDKVSFFPAAIDMTLSQMYKAFDRMKGSRAAKVVSAQRIDMG